MEHRTTYAFLTLFLLLPTLLVAQSIPRRGEARTLEVATWNLKFFGDPDQPPSNDERALDYVEHIMEATDIDLWGLQEIREPAYFYRLLDSLGSGYEGQLGPDTSLRLAFIYRTEAIQPTGPVQQILQDRASDFAGRPPLRLDARVTLPDTTFEVTFIVLHMKAQSDIESYQKRQQAAQALKTYIDLLLPQRPVVVLGDFNDELERSIVQGKPSPYQALVADSVPSPDPQYYFFPTLALERRGEWSICGYQSLIDHILVTDELRPLYEPGSADALDELTTAIPGYCSAVSDHLPVMARFRRPQATAIEASPLAGAHVQVYPQPVEEILTVEMALPGSAPVTLELFDLLGRQVMRDVVRIPARPFFRWQRVLNLPPGVYFLRLQQGTYLHTTTVVRR